MATEVSLPQSPVATLLVEARERAPRWTAAAWGAIGITTLFLGITFWWLTQDRSIPVFDAGLHLVYVLNVYHALTAGRLHEAFSLTAPYPPLVYLVGSVGIAIGGAGVAPPIIANNLVFVPLLALGCYQVGRRAFGPTAGLLAVVFALGSPLATAQFHVFMVDAPETAMVAVSIWLIIASEEFSRVGVSALAGLTVGLGLLTKEPFAFFVAGILAVTIVRMGVTFVRDGSLRWRGLAAFAIVALAVALPWYITEYSTVHARAASSIATAGRSDYGNDIAPARYSVDNFTWYFWNFINYQFWVPLFAFAVAGWIWTTVRLARRQPVSHLAPELMIGALVAWFAITDTFVHDVRYSEPLLVFLAVIGTGWITQIGSRLRIPLTAALAIFATINMLGVSFGVGKDLQILLPGSRTPTLQRRDWVQIASTTGFLVGGPQRDGDLLATLQDLHRQGVRVLDLDERFQFESDFSTAGIAALAQLAGITTEEGVSFAHLNTQDAVFAHGEIKPGEVLPCIKLSNGSGVWIRLGDPLTPGNRDYCPTRHPSFYGPAAKVAPAAPGHP